MAGICSGSLWATFFCPVVVQPTLIFKTKSGSMSRKTRILNAAIWSFVIVFAILFGYFVIFFLAISSQWLSVWSWAMSGLLAIMLLIFSRFALSKKVFKRLGVYVLICFLAVMPIYSVSSTILYQSIAQNVATPREAQYFRNLLERNYTYMELVSWENSSMSWDSSGITTTLTDPIEIYAGHKARCGGYAILYAALCVSQGYRCRIVDSLFNDHVWNEVYDAGKWLRVDASPVGHPELGQSEHIGYPLFYEEVWHSPPILALAFENSSIMDVTSNYRSDHWSLLSGSTIVFACIAAWFAFCIFIIWRRQTFSKRRKTPYNIV